MQHPERTTEFRKDPDQELRLRQINDLLSPLERQLIAPFNGLEQPVVWIVGAPRSGTTLLAQLLARTGGFSYVTNHVARFWMAPYVGMLLQQALYPDWETSTFSLESKLGFSPKSLSAPHEFGYFWERWFPFETTQKLSHSQLSSVDRDSLVKELAALESLTGRPLFFKNLGCGLQLPFLAEVFPRSVFVLCQRDPTFNCQSLITARRRIYGDHNLWWSLRPREYEQLLQLSPFEQVAGQVHFVLRDLSRSLAMQPEKLWVDVRYDELCQDPKKTLARIDDAVRQYGGNTSCRMNEIPSQLETRDYQQVSDDEFVAIRAAVNKYFEANGQLKESVNEVEAP